MSTFACVGNGRQPFSRLLAAVAKSHHSLPQPVFVQYGAADRSVLGKVAGNPFVSMGEFEQFVAKANVLIMHAGAGSVIHAIRAGRVPVVVPRLAEHNECVDNHQVEFTEQLRSTGRIVVCDDLSELTSCVASAMKLQKQVKISVQQPKLVSSVRAILHQL